MGRPFLKWAGGKRQLIPEIIQNLPLDFDNKEWTYVEPFLGGGALLFHMLNHYDNVSKVIINDSNSDLISSYTSIRDDLENLIIELKKIEEEYLMASEDSRAAFYYKTRKCFNEGTTKGSLRSAQFIFLNRTGFNGLYRVNKKDKFNVPHGKYAKPNICNSKNLKKTNQILQHAIILNGDYKSTLEYCEGDNIFFYLDPPYRPLTKTSSFNSYSKKAFDDNEQIRLKKFCDFLDAKGIKWLLSNSDPKNYNPDDDFFDDLYKAYSIKRIQAKRRINSVVEQRGTVSELLICNY